MNKYITEFIGTFFLVFTIGMTVINTDIGSMAPLAIGAVLMVMVYAGGHISGAHYNPAVTLAVFIRGKMEAKDIIPYWAAQCIGAVLAALLVNNYTAGPNIVPLIHNPLKSISVEFLFTFALVYVVLNVATSDKTSGNSYYGLAIGFIVIAGAYSVGAVSGGAFNPAVALGISSMGLSSFSNIWIYLVGNFAGAALAAVVFKMTDK